MDTFSVISNVTLNVLTAFLGIVTAWMAYATQTMAKAAKQSIEADSTPYFAFAGLSFIPTMELDAQGQPWKKGVKLSVVLRNPGKVRVRYEMRHLRMTLNGTTLEGVQWANTGLYVHPSEDTMFHYGHLQPSAGMSSVSQGTAEIELSFWGADETQKYQLTQHLTFILMEGDVWQHQWVSTKEEYKKL